MAIISGGQSYSADCIQQIVSNRLGIQWRSALHDQWPLIDSLVCACWSPFQLSSALPDENGLIGNQHGVFANRKFSPSKSSNRSPQWAFLGHFHCTKAIIKFSSRLAKWWGWKVARLWWSVNRFFSNCRIRSRLRRILKSIPHCRAHRTGQSVISHHNLQSWFFKWSRVSMGRLLLKERQPCTDQKISFCCFFFQDRRNAHWIQSVFCRWPGEHLKVGETIQSSLNEASERSPIRLAPRND